MLFGFTTDDRESSGLYGCASISHTGRHSSSRTANEILSLQCGLQIALVDSYTREKKQQKTSGVRLEQLESCKLDPIHLNRVLPDRRMYFQASGSDSL